MFIRNQYTMNQITINGRTWTARSVSETGTVSAWNSKYISPDGDYVNVYIDTECEDLVLRCFSGAGLSAIQINVLDFSQFRDKADLHLVTHSFEEQCIRIADYFCRILCEYRE